MLSAANKDDRGIEAKDLKRFKTLLETEAKYQISNGSLEVTMKWQGQTLTSGFTRRNLRSGNRKLSFMIMALRIDLQLREASDRRLDLPAFSQEWELFEKAASRLSSSPN